MKKIITFLLIGLITSINAQGITNTLGGNTVADKFIIENSDSDVGLAVTGDRKVGIGTANPISKLHIYDDVNSALSLRLQNANTGTGASAKLYFDGSNHAGISVFGPSYSGSENVMRIFNNRSSPDGSIDFVVKGDMRNCMLFLRQRVEQITQQNLSQQVLEAMLPTSIMVQMEIGIFVLLILMVK
jgi:hypothetical protein